MLDCVYGGKANITVPYLYDSFRTKQKNCEKQTNVEESGKNNDVIGYIVLNADGDVIASNLTDDDLDTLSVINMDSFLSSIETSLDEHPHLVSDSEDPIRTQSNDGVESLGSVVDVSIGQGRRLAPDTEDTLHTQSDDGVEFLCSDVDVSTGQGRRSAPDTEDTTHSIR